jgi:hypothetical protein
VAQATIDLLHKQVVQDLSNLDNFLAGYL